jgi:hypothetical protein
VYNGNGECIYGRFIRWLGGHVVGWLGGQMVLVGV